MHVEQIADLVDGRSRRVAGPAARAARDSLAAAGRFDAAATARDRLAVLVEAVDRRQRLGALASIAELVAAAPDGAGGWELAVLRHGRLVAAGHARRGVDPMPVVDLLVASAETVQPGAGPLPGASAEETGTVCPGWSPAVPGWCGAARHGRARWPAAAGGARFTTAAAVARHQLRDDGPAAAALDPIG